MVKNFENRKKRERQTGCHFLTAAKRVEITRAQENNEGRRQFTVRRLFRNEVEINSSPQGTERINGD